MDSNGKSVVTALHNSMPSGIHPTLFSSQAKPPQSQGEQPGKLELIYVFVIVLETPTRYLTHFEVNCLAHVAVNNRKLISK